MDEKSMQFANFNITFGENDAPMLKHFSDIIFPAFSGDYIRGKRDSVPRYFFAGVEIKEVDNEYVMVGNFYQRNAVQSCYYRSGRRISVYTSGRSDSSIFQIYCVFKESSDGSCPK